MEAEIHAKLTYCFLAPYCAGVSLTACSPAMEIICACSLRGVPWGSKVWHTFDMWDQNCNASAEPPMHMSRLYTYVKITKPCSASLHSAITVPASTDKSFLLSQNGAGCPLCESYLYDICHSLLKVFWPTSSVWISAFGEELTTSRHNLQVHLTALFSQTLIFTKYHAYYIEYVRKMNTAHMVF